MKQLIIDIPVQTKKDVIIDTKWLVYQEYEHVTLWNGNWSSRDIRVLETYKAVMLKLDIDVDKLTGAQTDYAGVDDAPSLVIRGDDVGEIVAEIRRFHFEGSYAYRVQTTPKAVKALLTEQVYPKLIRAVERNKETLYEEAKSKAVKSSKYYLQNYKERAVKLEAELQKMIDSVN